MIDQSIQRIAPIGTEAVPQRQVVGAIDHVDGVELEAAGILDETREVGGGETPAARAIEVLALQEQPGDGAARDPERRADPGGHAGNFMRWTTAWKRGLERRASKRGFTCR